MVHMRSACLKTPQISYLKNEFKVILDTSPLKIVEEIPPVFSGGTP